MREPTMGSERVWERGWDGHVLAQRRRLARLSLAEKLAWLEEAQKLASHLRRGEPVTRSAGDEPGSAVPPQSPT